MDVWFCVLEHRLALTCKGSFRATLGQQCRRLMCSGQRGRPEPNGNTGVPLAANWPQDMKRNHRETRCSPELYAAAINGSGVVQI